jgi:hypothetical protein
MDKKPGKFEFGPADLKNVQKPQNKKRVLQWAEAI